MKAFRRVFLNAFVLLLPALAVFFSVSLNAQRVADLPKPTDYVSDYAHVLSPGAVTQIDHIAAELDHTNANAQLAVVIVHTLNGEEAADYATQLFDKFKIGAKGTDHGVLILLAVDDHKRFIEVGYGLEGILPDGKLGDIGRAMVPDLRANDYDGAVNLAVNDIAQTIAADAKVTLDEAPVAQQRAPQRHSGGMGIFKLIIILIFVAFYLFRGLGRWGLFGLWGLSMFGGGGRGGGWGGGGGGGWGGGDSGGGGGFGGFGGGSTGGGGAGGSW
jgi:uncharacterized protein